MIEKRRALRFTTNLPMHILRLNGRRANRAEKALDISSGGICFRTQAAVETGVRIEYIVTLTSGPPHVRIRCAGKVLRVQPRTERGDDFTVAATLDRYQFVRTESWEGEMHLSAIA